VRFELRCCHISNAEGITEHDAAGAEDQLASRLFLGPALRTQPDRRLVELVRDGYETAFEEIVRRYRRPLDRFAAAIVGARSEDVTQDAFSKALLAPRGTEAEIELRPWCRASQLHHSEHGDDHGSHDFGNIDDLVVGATVDDALLVLKDGRAWFAKIDLDD